MKRRHDRPAPQASPESVGEYSKSVDHPARVGETIQLIERGIAPVRAGAKFAVVASLVACIVSFFALGWAVLR